MTFREAINHSEESSSLINQIEDCLESWNGRERYDSILTNMVAELEKITGYRYELESIS